MIGFYFVQLVKEDGKPVRICLRGNIVSSEVPGYYLCKIAMGAATHLRVCEISQMLVWQLFETEAEAIAFIANISKPGVVRDDGDVHDEGLPGEAPINGDQKPN